MVWRRSAFQLVVGIMNFPSRAKLACLSFIQSSFSVSRSIPYKKNIYRWISDMAANISVIPRSSLMDRKVKICISGLEAGQPVTLHATVVGDVKEVFESHAHYIANKEGVVDISRDISCGGSYHGIEQMGFLWGMTQTPGQRKGLRLMKRDVTKPYIIELNCFDGHLKPDEGFVNSLAQHTLQPIASAALEKWYIGEGVQRIPVRVGRIRGTLFIPPGNGPFAGVIDLFGTAGGLNEHKASLLASHGFTVLSLAYFNFDDLPKFLPYCEMDYFEEAAEWLVKHPAVIPGGIGVMGVSKGAEIVLMMAVLRKDIIRAVVPISTSYIVSSVPFKVKGDLTGSHYDFSKCRASEDGSLILRDCVPVHGLDELEPPVVIPVETIECPMLIICGEDDEDVSAFEMAQEVLARMNSHGKGGLCTVLSYPGTGHLIEPPYAPHCYASYHKTFQTNFAWGGNAKDHSRAQEDSWGKIIEFFRKNLGKKLNSYR